VFAQIGPETSRYGAHYAESGPDGLEFGPDGALHVAIYGEGRVLRFSARGALLGEIQVEPRYVTNVAFSDGGAMAIVGALQNDRAPFRGEVRISDAE
jgi:sugar lactone lactonase YvrE